MFTKVFSEHRAVEKHVEAKRPKIVKQFCASALHGEITKATDDSQNL
jgi:hypothetical protein